MGTFNITKAIEHHDRRKRERLQQVRENLGKKDILRENIEKELESCKEVRLKLEYIEDYLRKDGVNSGVKGDIPDYMMSHKKQAILQKFLLEKLVNEDRNQIIKDIVPEMPPVSVTQRKLKNLILCEKRLMSVGENYILGFVDDLKKYLDDHELEIQKMKVKEIAQLFEHLWGLYENNILAAQENEFNLVREKAILLDYIDDLSEADKNKYMKEYFVKKGLNGLRSGQKLFSKSGL